MRTLKIPKILYTRSLKCYKIMEYIGEFEDFLKSCILKIGGVLRDRNVENC
jgi:hypothetical protein